MGLIGMFPYSAIDLFTFETIKQGVVKRNMKLKGVKHEEDALPSNFSLALMGGFSGAIGASSVYPINLLRTRLQSQGTAQHPRTYTGVLDVTRQTIKGEGVRGLFKGLTPNLLKVVPAVSIVSIHLSGLLLCLSIANQRMCRPTSYTKTPSERYTYTEQRQSAGKPITRPMPDACAYDTHSYHLSLVFRLSSMAPGVHHL